MKKAYALLTALCLILALSACSKQPDSSSSSQEESSAPSSSSSESSEVSEPVSSEPISSLPESSTTDTSPSAGSAASSLPSSSSVSPQSSSVPQPTAAAEVLLSTEELEQGDIIVIQVPGTADTKVSATSTLGFTPSFFLDEEGTTWTALLPTSYKIQVGTYRVTVTVDGASSTHNFKVNASDFPVQYLTVDEETTSATIENDAANQEWNTKIEPLKKISDPERYWSGPFIEPVQAEISTEYGSVRYTNGSTTPSHHGGMDFAADRGDQVIAPNAGRVLFAEYIQLTGNTVVIEHGYGLKSFYYHMDSLDTQTGQIVKQGDPIGKVGSTGFSTGPHLHYAMLVNNIFIDPVPFFGTPVPFFE